MSDPPTPVTQRLEWTTFGDDAGALYERYMVPAIFGSWAEDLVHAGRCKHGDRVLDVACGTGVVARCAIQRVGRRGHVVGLDLSPAMLAAARSAARETSIEWREGSALVMPFSDRSFDVVLCQQGLQFFPDRAAALRQMRRVLAIGGRLALSVFRTSEGHLALAEGLAPVLGATASSILEPFVLADACQRSPHIEPPGSGKLSHPGSPIVSQAGSPIRSHPGSAIWSHPTGRGRIPSSFWPSPEILAGAHQLQEVTSGGTEESGDRHP